MPSEPTDSATPLLRVRGLHFHYPDGRAALHEVSFAITAGERVALIGPNGAGKSTLLLHLNGLLPGSETAYEHHHHLGDLRGHRHSSDPSVWVSGLPIATENLPEIRRQIGLLFQDPDDQLFCPTVGEDVAFGPRNLELPEDEVARRVAESLSAVGLTGFEDRVPSRLSLGEKRRACLAGLLACAPTLLALDEPTASLDPRNRRGLIRLLSGLPMAMLIATHDLEFVRELCPRCLVIDEGRIAADGSTDGLLADSALMEAHGLEVPQSLRPRSG